MRVLWITERFPPNKGGVASAAARITALLAPHLERLDVIHLVTDLPAGWLQVADRGNPAVYRLGRAPDEEQSQYLLLQAAAGLSRENGYQLLHGFYATYAGYLAVLLGRTLGLPALVSLRGNDLHRGMFQASRGFFLHWTLQYARAITAVSREMLEQVRAFANREQSVHYLPNSVDADRFCPGEPRSDHLQGLRDSPRPWIGFAGQARFKKGLPVLLELARELEQEQTGTLVLLGGVRADEREAVEGFRLRYPGAAARLCEIPYTADHERLLSLVRCLDLAVFPSFWEGMPNALLQAMACGVPVLAAKTGGIGEVLQDGVNGFTVELTRLHGFAQQALHVLSLPEERRAAVAAAARRWVQDNASPAVEREAWLDLYRRLI